MKGTMKTTIIGFLLYSMSMLCLSLVFIYRIVKPKRPESVISEYDYTWERVLEVVFNIAQAGSSIAIITATIISIATGQMLYWLDLVILFSLQLPVGTNVSITIF